MQTKRLTELIKWDLNKWIEKTFSCIETLDMAKLIFFQTDLKNQHNHNLNPNKQLFRGTSQLDFKFYMEMQPSPAKDGFYFYFF